MALPPLIIVKASGERYVLLSLTQLSENNYINAKIIENSKYLFSSAEWRADGIHGRPTHHTFLRMSSRSVPKPYNSTLCKTNCYVKLSWHEPIHIYSMTNPNVVLPSPYYTVFTGQDTNERWHFKEIPTLRVGSPEAALTPFAPFAPSAPEEEMPSEAPRQKIPLHIIQGFIESAIQKKEVCPITLETLVMGQIAMTACGHLFERSALESALTSESASCPQCRSNVCKSDVIML